jgi:hypothetical protein
MGQQAVEISRQSIGSAPLHQKINSEFDRDQTFCTGSLATRVDRSFRAPHTYGLICLSILAISAGARSGSGARPNDPGLMTV